MGRPDKLRTERGFVQRCCYFRFAPLAALDASGYVRLPPRVSGLRHRGDVGDSSFVIVNVTEIQESVSGLVKRQRSLVLPLPTIPNP